MIGRTRALGITVLFYSLFAGMGAFVRTQEQMLVLRFVVGLGIGGVWPNAVSLASECWPMKSRAIVAGFMGTALNGGSVSYAWKESATDKLKVTLTNGNTANPTFSTHEMVSCFAVPQMPVPTNVYGIVGMPATSSPAVEAYVNAQNPTGGGTTLVSAASGFTSCTIP